MQLWDPEYIFDTFSDYKCYCPTGFYMFWAFSLEDTSARKDHFGRWINNSSNHSANFLTTYFDHEEHKDSTSKYYEFKKIEYKWKYKRNNQYPAIMIYMRQKDGPYAPLSQPRAHGNAKDKNSTFVGFSQDQLHNLRQKVESSKEKPKILHRNLKNAGVTVRNTKQIKNIQQENRNKTTSPENAARLAALEKDFVIQNVSATQNKTFALVAPDAIQIMKKTRIWYTDTTFNVSNSFATAVVFMDANFEKGGLQNAFLYLHTVRLINLL